MKCRKFLYGAMGLLSLLGFIGVFTSEKNFLFFFAFAVDFEYWFMKSDEMLEHYMNKSASRAFYCSMIIMAGATLFMFFVEKMTGNEALSSGLTYGWATAVIVYTLSTAYFGFKEKWGLSND